MTGGCGDDGGSATDASVTPDSAVTDATVPDAALPDAQVCVAPAAGAIGGACTDDLDCGDPIDGYFCVNAEENFPAQGYCTRSCTMNTDCDANSQCVDIVEPTPPALHRGGGAPDMLCLPNCCAGDTCAAGFLCQDTIAGTIPLDKQACTPGNGDASDHDACEGFYDCNGDSFCITGPESPNGMCAQVGCIVGDNTTCTHGANSICVGQTVGGPGFCVQQCTLDADCRESEGYQCLMFGGLSVCAHRGFGDACVADGDCGADPWTCDVAQPNGYCTIACDPANLSAECGDNASCYDPPGGGTTDAYCADNCMGAPNQGTCRPGYLCSVTDGVCLPAPAL